MSVYVEILLHRGVDLAVKDINGKSDPYCYIQLFNGANEPLGEKRRSKTIPKTLNPVWNETFKFDSNPFAYRVLIELWDYDQVGSDDAMGKVDIVLTADPIRERKFVVVPQKNESAPKDLNALCDLASSMTKYHPVATVYGDDSTAEQLLLKAIKEDPDAARPYLILSRRSARERVVLPSGEKVSRIQLVLMAIERNAKNNEAWAELFSRMKDGETIQLLDGEVLSREDVLGRARGIGYSSYRLEKALAWSQLGGDVQQRYKHLRKAVAIASQGLGWRSLYQFMSENRIVEEPVKVGNEEVYLVDFPFRQLNLDPFRKSSWAFAKDWYKKLQTSTLSNLIESFKMWPLLMQGRMLDLDPTCLDLPEGETRTLTLPSGQTITRLEWCARVVTIKPNLTGLSALLREMTTDNVHSVSLPNGKTITKDDIMQKIRQNR